jgi:thioesterase domain-containing protein
MGPAHWKQEIVKKLRRWKQPNKNDNNAPVNSLYDQQYQAASGFCPSSYHGQTTVIRASAQSLTRPVFGALGWESFVTPEPRVRVVRGNHLSILNARNSKRVSQVLLELIESSSR